MTAKEKAEYFIDSFSAYVEKETINGYSPQTELENAKKCALITISELMANCFQQHHYEWWKEVKEELTKL